MPTIQEIEAELARRNSKSEAPASSGGLSLDDLDAELARRKASSSVDVGRMGGLAGRMGVQGGVGAVMGIPSLAADALAGYSNLVNQYITNPAMGAIESYTGKQMPRARILPPMQASIAAGQNAEALATKMGLPQPETDKEKLLVRGGTAGVEALGLGGLGRMVGGTFGTELAKAPIMSPIVAGSGATASEYVRQKGGTPGQQMAAGLAAGMAPAFLTGAVPAGVALFKNALRGPNAAAMQRNIAEMEANNIPVSVGSTSESNRARMIEGGLANTPTGRGPITTQRDAENAAIGREIQGIVTKLAPNGADTMTAGQAISSGITNTYIPKARALSQKLYGRVDAAIPPSTRVELPTFTQTLKDLTTPTPGAVRTTGQFVNPFLKELGDNIAKDLGVKDLSSIRSIKPTYEIVSALRTRIGAKLSDPSLLADVPRGELKRLYKSLMGDIESGLSGSPDALRELKRANGFTTQLHNKVDDILDPVISKNVPEKVFNSVLQNTEEAGSVLRNVMGSISPDQRKVVAGAIINRLGKARASAQNAEGDRFSVETFLTRWNQLSPTAQKQVLNQFPADMRRSYETLTQAAERIRNVNSAMPNPSGTGVNTSFFALAGGAGAGALDLMARGDPTLLGTTAAVAGGLNISARAMTNPKFVNWLAQQTKLPANALSGQISLLNSMFQKEDDDLVKQDVQSFIDSVKVK